MFEMAEGTGYVDAWVLELEETGSASLVRVRKPWISTLFLSTDLRPSQAPGLFNPSLSGFQACLDSLSRGQSQLCVPATASADSPEVLGHILFWVPHLFPRLRSDSFKLSAGLLFSDSCFAE
ncbi:hypothetical protein AMECASPLE_010203 [Ameca splendens]|uniref:Uncharacterized protein n=1 Tax=Ameca splendens TaxID=208324 RepID=A0ABV0Z060_9TELE